MGARLARKDGTGKVTGRARYVADLVAPGTLFGRTIRSTVPRGRVTGLRLDLGADGFTVVTAADIPGRNRVALIADDQPCLADGRVEHAEEAIALLAHADRGVLARAMAHVDYAPEPPCLDPRSSRDFVKQLEIAKGDLAQGFAAADLVVEGEYRTGHQEQLYIEPHGVIATPGDGGITVAGSLQCPYYVHKALCVLLGLPPDRVRVVQTETGGGFGGKEDYPSIIAGHAALLAWKAGRPVALLYDRQEDMAATTKRHPAIVRHRTGVRRDGRLVAIEVDVLLDAGAYTTLSPVVLSRACLHATGAYRCDHVLVRGRAARTNTPPNGAFRGFGAPQTLFAAEVHMDRVAAALGMDPVTLRERNLLRPGDTTATGQILADDCSAEAVLAEAIRRTDFRARREALRGTSRGLGLALFFHGAGFTGAGETMLASRAALELTPSGVRVLASSTEIGQGTRTALAQIVAEATGLDVAVVEVVDADTAHVPDSGPTVASRTCMVVGNILRRCGEILRERLGGLSPAEYLDRHGPLRVEEQYVRPAGLEWDDATYRGSAYGCYGYGCNVAEVEVDPDTGTVQVHALTAVIDVGRAINPGLVRGQIEGGTAQGVGYALIEDVVMREGRMANAQLTNYAIPTTLDTPPTDVAILEHPYANGPYGAKGVGEIPINGPAPAIVNALRATGLDLREIPATPERVLEASCASR
jgi:CO/xanthine dehydrogenase Mo-binding subunit